MAVLASCTTKRSPLTYFEDIEQSFVIDAPTSAYSPKIAPDDELLITVASEDSRATAAYNLPMENPASLAVGKLSTTPQHQTYLVDAKGNISMPILGTIHVAGLTTEQLREQLVGRISADVTNPEVTVRLLNFNVNVAGEVKQPGRIKVNGERFSVLDALTAAGDLTEYGERNNVLIVREEDGKRIAHRVSLNSSDLLTSPYFYLQPNDYVYVTPNQIRKDNSKYNQNNAFKVSVISAVVSGVSVIASLVIALAIK